MSNTLTQLSPILFSAAAKVAREPHGLIDSITTDFNSQGVAKGDVVRVPVAPPLAEVDFVPSNVPPQGGDTTAGTVPVTIDYSKKVSWYLTGEQQRSLENSDTYTDWVTQLVSQGMRTLINGLESYSVGQVVQGASRATGTPGVTPFSSGISQLADLRKIMADNGCPFADVGLVLPTSSSANLRKQGIFQFTYEAGSDTQLRTGQFLPTMGMNLRESAGISLWTSSLDTTAYTLNGAAVAGQTSIAVQGGTGNLQAGDIITFSDTTANTYVIGANSTSTQLNLGLPGLREAHNSGATITNLGNYTPNLALERSSTVAVVRPPLVPVNPTIQQLLITDDQSGLTFLMLDIAQYGQRSWELHLAYGVKAINSFAIATLIS
jgi:hypothetical protein